jgi:hypothetical protein
VGVGYRGHHLVRYGATCCSLKHAGVLHRRGPKTHCMGQPRDWCRDLHVSTFYTHLLNIHLCFNTDSTVNEFVLKMLSDPCFLSPTTSLHFPHTLICSHMGSATLTHHKLVHKQTLHSQNCYYYLFIFDTNESTISLKIILSNLASITF